MMEMAITAVDRERKGIVSCKIRGNRESDVRRIQLRYASVWIADQRWHILLGVVSTTEIDVISDELVTTRRGRSLNEEYARKKWIRRWVHVWIDVV